VNNHLCENLKCYLFQYIAFVGLAVVTLKSVGLWAVRPCSLVDMDLY
jgi:hypothetical protein